MAYRVHGHPAALQSRVDALADLDNLPGYLVTPRETLSLGQAAVVQQVGAAYPCTADPNDHVPGLGLRRGDAGYPHSIAAIVQRGDHR